MFVPNRCFACFVRCFNYTPMRQALERALGRGDGSTPAAQYETLQQEMWDAQVRTLQK